MTSEIQTIQPLNVPSSSPGAVPGGPRGTSRWGSQSHKYWSGMVAKQSKSPLTVKAFCKQEGFSTCSFYTWRKRLSSPGAVPGGPRGCSNPLKQPSSFPGCKNFVELVPNGSNNGCDSGVRVAIGDQVRISVVRGFDPETFRSVLSVLCDVLQ